MKQTVLLFCFDIWMFSSYLEREVGLVERVGHGSINGYALKFRKTRDAGFAKAEAIITPDAAEIIWGAVYRLNLQQYNMLSRKFKKDFDLEFLEAEVNINEGIIKMQRPFLPEHLPNYGDAPYNWYKELMLAGAESFNLPPDYLEKLRKISTIEDSTWRKKTFLDFLKYPALIKKNLGEAVAAIKRQNKPRKYTARLAGHTFDGCTFDVHKAGHEYVFDTKTPIPRGTQLNYELNLNKNTLILKQGRQKIYIPDKNFLVSKIAYDQFDFKLLHGSFSCFSTLPINTIDEHYCRMMIPIDKRIDLRSDFEYVSYLENGRLHQGLIKLKIIDIEIHYYQLKIEKTEYLVIDALATLPLKRFMEIVHAIQLVYALLQGDYLSSEARVFFYDTPDMTNAIGSYFHTTRDSIYGYPGIFTTNGFFGIYNNDDALDEDGRLIEEERNNARVTINRISTTVFSNLCNELLSSEKILRSMIILVTTQNVTLESRIPSQFVALEALTATLVKKGGNKGLKPITDDDIAADLVTALTATLDQFSKDHGFTEEQDKKLEPLRKKLLHFNTPPNMDKLKEGFTVVGYKPNDAETAVIKLRDKFLHGSTLEIDFETSEDYGYKELLHISLRLHMLLSVIMMKKTGY